MNLLARLLSAEGRQDEARDLLVECLRDVLDHSIGMDGWQWRSHEAAFQQYRSLYLELFPDSGEEELLQREIPISTFSYRESPGDSD
jgi:hypothetical protein